MNAPSGARRRGAAVLTALALGALTAGCTGSDKPSPTGTASGSSSSSSGSSSSSSDSSSSTTSGSSSSSAAGDSAATLAKVVIAGASAPAATDRGAVTLQPPLVSDPMRIAVTRLQAGAHETVLQVTANMVNPGTAAIPPIFSAEASYRLGELSPARALTWVSVFDHASKTRLFPYQYRWQPSSRPQLACVCMNEPLVRQQPQVWTLILPPLPAGTRAVDVTIPRGFTDSQGLAEKAVATIRNVPVTRS